MGIDFYAPLPSRGRDGVIISKNIKILSYVKNSHLLPFDGEFPDPFRTEPSYDLLGCGSIRKG
jgi:hypothetical protein